MRILLGIMILVFHANVWAASMEAFEFDSEDQEKTFKKLSDELRCLVCQNQSIADSNAGLAKDLRTEVHAMLKAGKTEQQIKEFMVERYGDYVLYEPPFKPLTWLLWFGPVILFLIGLFYVRGFISQQNASEVSGELSVEEAERLKNLQMELNLSDKTKSGKKSSMKGDAE